MATEAWFFLLRGFVESGTHPMFIIVDVKIP